MVRIVRWLVLLLVAASPAAGLAGRPVSRELSLQQLVSRADAVLVVSPGATPGRSAITLSDGCTASTWSVTIREVLHLSERASATTQARPLTRPLRPGSRAALLTNPTALQDCAYRKASRSSGVSFPAELYPSSLGQLSRLGQFSRPPELIVVFLSLQQGLWQLASEGAYESVTRLDEIRQAIARPPSSVPPP